MLFKFNLKRKCRKASKSLVHFSIIHFHFQLHNLFYPCCIAFNGYSSLNGRAIPCPYDEKSAKRTSWEVKCYRISFRSAASADWQLVIINNLLFSSYFDDVCELQILLNPGGEPNIYSFCIFVLSPACKLQQIIAKYYTPQACKLNAFTLFYNNQWDCGMFSIITIWQS